MDFEENKPEDNNEETPGISSTDRQHIMQVDLVEPTNKSPATDSQLQNSDVTKPKQARPSWYSNEQHIAGNLKQFFLGNDYQLKLLMLFALEATNSEVNFRLATETAEAGKFDDLLYRYNIGEGLVHYRFIQAKLRQFSGEQNKIKVSDLKSNSDSNAFSLQKCFVSYLKTIDSPEFRDGEVQDFIICTNTGFDFEPSKTKKEQKRSKDSKEKWKGYFSEKTDRVLNVGGKLYTFSAVPSIRAGVVAELKPIFEESLARNKLPSDGVNQMGEFLDRLVFAVDQPSGATLERKIKEKIGGAFNLINDITYNNFYKFMSDWKQHRIMDKGEEGPGRAHYLTHVDVKAFFDGAEEKIASLESSWDSNPQHFAGHAKKYLHSIDYQLKLLMLFALKGRNSELVFRLAADMPEAEKFDDLVFRHDDGEGQIRYRFLQALHRQFLREENKIKVSDLKSNNNKNDFSLQKYFVSYLKIIEKPEFGVGVPQDFIICTNADFDFEPSTTKKDQKRLKDIKKTWKGYFSEKTDEDKSLNVGGKRYTFSADRSIRDCVVAELKPIFEESLRRNKLPSDAINKMDEFLDKLVFAVGQPSGATLERKIKENIGGAFNLMNDSIYNDFYKFMSEWMQHCTEDGNTFFLTHVDVAQFFDHAKKRMASLGCWDSNPQHFAGNQKQYLHGNDHHLKLLLLFAWEDRNSEVEFRLVADMPEEEKFYDLGFRYNDGEGQISYRFIQAKHQHFLGEENRIKVSDLKSNSNKKDFSLQKCFVSYLKTIEKPEFRGQKVQDFIICTNTGFDFEPSTTKKDQKRLKDSKETWKGYFSEKTDRDSILNVGGKRYTFSADPSIRAGVVAELLPIFKRSLRRKGLSSDGIDKLREFLDKLVFAVEQPSGASLERKINEKIGGAFNLINDITYNDFYKFMSVWMQHSTKDGRAFLTRADVTQFFDEAKEQIASLGLASATLLHKRSIEKSGFKFKDDIQAVKMVRTFLNKQGNGEKQILTIYQKSALLSAIKVRQVLADRNTKEDIDIFCDLKSLSLLEGSAVDPIKTFKSEGKDHLIIEHNSALDKEAKELLKSLYRGLVLKPGKRLILIIPQEQKEHTETVLDNLFREPTVDKNKKYIALEDDDNKLTYLTPESQTSLLEKGKVIFQGQDVSLGDLINKDDEDMKALVYGEVLSQLINNESIDIGIKRPDLSDLESIYYVTSVGVDEEQFSRAVEYNDLFVVSGTTKGQLMNSKLITRFNIEGENAIRVFEEDNVSKEDKFIILTDKDDEKNLKDFKRICSDCPKRAVHLIEKKGNELTWKRSYDASLYVHRELCHVVIDESSLKAYIDNNQGGGKGKKDIFAISGAGNKEEFNKLCNIEVSDKKDVYISNEYDKKNHVIMLNDEEQSFKDLCDEDELRENYNIHWLQNKKWENNNNLVWKRSEGEMSQIHNLQDTERKFPIEEADFNRIINTEKVVVIAGEPGEGKSTALAHLLKQPEKFEWIIKLDLINLQEQLRNFTRVNDLNSIIKDLFSKIDIGVKWEFGEKLLKYRIKHQGKVTLLFDSFDEITDENQKTVIELLKFLSNTQAKIQITTGLNVKDKLENALSVFSYIFETFSEKNREEFLQKYWKASLKFISTDETIDEAIDKGIETLFKPFHKNVQNKRYALMSIPLLTRMFAEIHQETVEGFCSQDNRAETESLKQEVERLSTLDLYERFIERKYDIYFKEKTQIENITGYVKEKLTKALNEDHQSLAFKQLFPQFAQLLDKHKLPSQEDEQDMKLVGIIQSTNSDSSPYFIHQTFAEYFAAGLLADMIGRRGIKPIKMDLARSLLREQILRKKYNVTRNFFDLMLGKDNEGENKYEIHNAVLNNDESKVKELLSDSQKAGTIVNSFDKGGRMPLHLAAAYGCSAITQILLNKGADVTEADRIFGWCPFIHADRSYHLDAAILILKAKDANDRYKFKDYIFLGEPINERLPIGEEIENLLRSDYKQKQTLLSIAVGQGYFEFTKFLLEQGVDVNAKDEYGRTPLEMAMSHDSSKDTNLELVKLLIKGGADHDAEDVNGLLYKATIEESGSKFKDDIQAVKMVRAFLNKQGNGEKQILTIYQKSALLSAIKVRQVLADRNTKVDVDIFSDLKSLSLLVGSSMDPIKAFKSDSKDHLIIEHKSALDEDAKKLLKSLYKELVLKPDKRLILIIPREHKDHTETVLDNLFRELTIDKNKKYIALEDDDNNFTDLTPESQTSLLEKGKVIFQGQEVSLGVLINKNKQDMKALVDGEVLSQLINNEAIEIGIKRPDLSDRESMYYVTSVGIEVEQFSRAVKNGDLFVVSGTTKAELSKLITKLNIQGGNAIRVFGKDNASKEDKFIILTDKDEETNLEDFKRICSECAVMHPERAVHLIEKKGNELTWKRSYDASFYVSRNICHVVIKACYLKACIDKKHRGGEEKRDIFAVSGAGSREEFEKLYNIKASDMADLYINYKYAKKNHVIMLNDEEKSFQDFCEEDELKDYYNIHWLQNKKIENNNILVWKRTDGEMSQIQKLQDEEMKFPIETNGFNRIINTEKVVVIAGEPGEGKSTALTHLLKQLEKFEWIIKLDLINLQEQLRNINCVNDLNGIIKDIFSKMDVGVKGELAERFLEYRIRHQGKVTLLFDGFHEITDENQKTVIEILKFLSDTQAQIHIITSLNVKDKLENALSVFSYTFVPFSKENQIEFLQKYWKASLKFMFSDEIIGEAIGEGIITLFEPFHANIKDRKYEFMSIPLLTRMFAEIHQETVESFCSQDNRAETESSLQEEEEELSVLDLYKRFIERKYDIYFKRKTQFENIAGNVKIILTKALDKVHQRLAFKQLFPQFSQLVDKHNFSSQKQENNLKSVGIIQSTNSDSTPYFIHQTFAEYFAAGLLADMIGRRESDPTKYNLAHRLLHEQIFKKENNLLRKFFDLMLTKENEGENKYEIHNAVLNNDESKLHELLSESQKAGTIVNSLDEGGRTPLHLAAAYGCSNIAQILLDNGADVTKADGTFGWYPFIYADRSYHMDTALLILKAEDANGRYKFKDYIFLGEPLNERLPISEEIENLLRSDYKQKKTLLSTAVGQGYLEFTQFLLERGVDVNAKDENGLTPLLKAVDVEYHKDIDPKVVKLLIEGGADINARNKCGGTPLLFAVRPRHGDRNSEIVQLLINKGADVNAKDENDLTPLLKAVDVEYHKDIDPKVVKLLIEGGANINARNKCGGTPLLFAVRPRHGDRNSEIVQLLINKGADVNAKDENGLTPLLKAVDVEYHKDIDPKVVKLLIEGGADINARNKCGGTPLLFAVRPRHGDRNSEIVQLLINKGAEVNAKDENGLTPLLKAVDVEYHKDIDPKVVKLLIEGGADINARNKCGGTPLLFAVRPCHRHRNSEIVQLLINKGADVNAKDENGMTPLLKAVDVGIHGNIDPEVVKLLIEGDADPNAQNKCGETPLHFAASPRRGDRNSVIVVQLLIDRRADVNAKDENGMTPLLKAVDVGIHGKIDLAVVKLLVKGEPDVNAKDKNGMTPLLKAVGSGDHDTNLQVVKLLIESEADINAVDKYGNNILYFTTNQQIRDLLQTHSQPRRIDATPKEAAPGSVQSEECPPSTSSGSSVGR